MFIKLPFYRRCIRFALIPALFLSITVHAKDKLTISEKKLISSHCDSLYKKLNLSLYGLKPEVFQKAFNGYSCLKAQQAISKSNLISIVDLSQSSNSKRLYIIDLEKGQIIYQTWVSHGRNSGNEFANSFSNAPNSFKTSIGFYVTGQTYSGKHGLSLQLKGVEKGINDLAEKRAIVIHGASYVSEDFIKQYGRLGRSQGCPAICEELSAPIIQLLKEGSCLFIYYPENNYLTQSEFLTD